MKYLEKQLKNTTTLKMKYKQHIEEHLQALREAKKAREDRENLDDEYEEESSGNVANTMVMRGPGQNKKV